MRAAVPRTFTDVLQRMVQLQYTSRLTLDKSFFDQISCLFDLIAAVDDALPADSAIRSDPLFTKLRTHRKIDHLNVVTSSLPRSCPTPATSRSPRSRPGSGPATRTRLPKASATSTPPDSGSG